MKSEAEIKRALAIVVASLRLIGGPKDAEENELLRTAKVAIAVLQWTVGAGKGEAMFQTLLNNLEEDLREAIKGVKDDKARHIN